MQNTIVLDANHPLVKNHQINGLTLLPGLAYIDMLYQLLCQAGHDFTRLELRNLTIYNPLAINDEQSIILNILCCETGEGCWQIRIEGQKQSSGAQPVDKELYITAEMYLREPVMYDEKLNLSQIKEIAQNTISLDKVYEHCRRERLVHTGFMKAEGVVYDIATAAIVDIAIGRDALASKEEVMFHPVLIDGSAIGAWEKVASPETEEQKLYLPLYYESFRASALMQERCVARLKMDSFRQNKELVYITLEFFNTQGEKIAELKNFAAKLIRDTSAIGLKQQYPLLSTVQPNMEIKTGIGTYANLEAMEKLLEELFAAKLQRPIKDIKSDAGFYEMGMNSVRLLQMATELEERLAIKFAPTLLFEYSTIAELASYLIKNYQDQMKQFISTEQTTVADDKMANYNFNEDVVKVRCTETAINNNTEIAIIGIAGQYPGAKNIDDFWCNLRDGKDCITEIPPERWEHSKYYDTDKSKPEKTYCKWGGFLKGVDEFEPLFFHISPKEAEVMDPQERLFLENVWNLFENAGYTRMTLQQQYQGRIGVYVGAMYQQYHAFESDIMTKSLISLSSYSSIANRVSFYFNFQGPSIAVDTACSSSTVAIHMACESLLRGECKLAVAGGVNLSIHPQKYLGLSQLQILGSSINSRSFSNGDGYLPAEGVGAVLLKPLWQAIQDKDRILAVIKSTTSNHGGHSSGYNVPNLNAQVQLIEDNFKKSGIDPKTISYVEAATNGSQIGDAIEVAALTKVFQKYTNEQQFCGIGSVKSNIGHAEAASGISQLTKVVLQLQHKQLVPLIIAADLNPNIDFKNSPFYLQQKLQEWKRPVIVVNGENQECKRQATVSSFGMGGTNAHIIVEEYVPDNQEQNIVGTMQPQIIIFSAKSQERLGAVVRQMLMFVKFSSECLLTDIAYTLQVGREPMEYRMAMLVGTQQDLIHGLEEYLRIAVLNGNFDEALVPIFTGNLETEQSDISKLLFGETGKILAQKLLQEHDYKKLAIYWVQGGGVNWELLHEGQNAKRIPLPTYPFAKEKYWVSTGQTEECGSTLNQLVTMNAEFICQNEIEDSIQQYISQFLAKELKIVQQQIRLDKNIQQYGVDSIILTKLIRDIEHCFTTTITRREIIEYRTIKSLAAYLAQKIKSGVQQCGTPTANIISETTQETEAVTNEQVVGVLEQFVQGNISVKQARILLEGGEKV
ncbi:MAG TPA: beta-ketoacyl synthase N-terminal-like domain-containing protein [Methylomusa anaerophila]|uniref:Polyketide synthase PksL n=1 Tax=Methylomusa anaerophila TaxID=1930071 RepID=A0A348AN92_9FIRM|nr:beta-ketoacyl synthase N-terminal-like domain-containing protein [Methylomusa anaerophila]BBB92540.1 polyketide synthase PksL [Methylomusa anaerophila]HML87605.1 beta-ketoacyl synthase N-terminal-like domain-containing protein [Methylomusa anaerophila]